MSGCHGIRHMKNTCLLLWLIWTAYAAVSCDRQHVESKGLPDTSEKAHALPGTWKLVQYIDYDSSSGEWIHTYGENPRGYFTYTKSGVVNLSISSEIPVDIVEDSIHQRYFTFGELLDKSVTYFGHFEIDAEKSVITHLPEGGSIPWYLGTRQPRQFILKVDSLFIGDPTFEVGRRVLVREVYR